ncbi:MULTISPECIES: hypothetical protein [unclassified Fusibacter]|uniref:hypothetical protein n=1 Tax=unclassified Fusibacter TaxID=2624464 RepID=UPI0010102B61|nr:MULTISPECIES: hypothetical protein [unclassified Fusibacter]MCK8058384.1 hypothetical protein [Fusibacter sp. A2]NPE20967.1 hypothetical protein [Fusibacter sp. A1]RXV63169.1 hypothetical protein DWB64_03955 [Fusibacter sp. A1]
MNGFINESVVLAYYIEQMEADNITFLVGKTKEKKEIERLILKIEAMEDIHQKIIVSKDLWKLLFEMSMSSIMPDKRGYDSIFNYFDAYVDFEELIFASDSFYRDHTLHCLWVYFLGEFLYNKPEFKRTFKYLHSESASIFEIRKLFGGMSRLQNLDRLTTVLDNLITVLKQSDATRCLLSLTHDLGYPLKKIKKVNSCISKILPYFSIRDYDEFNFAYANEQLSTIESFYDFLSHDIAVEFGVGSGPKCMSKFMSKVDGKEIIDHEGMENLTDEEIKEVEDFLQPKMRLVKDEARAYRMKHDFENYEHGIMSAFILYKELEGVKMIKRTVGDRQNLDISQFDYDKMVSLSQIFIGIADHTSKSYKINSLGTPSSFLILIDELEEFSRISRANQNRQYISELCKSAIYMEEDLFCVDFVFDNEDIPNVDPEFAFKGRCKKMLSIFDIPNLDKDLKIRLQCIDKLFGADKHYTLEIRHCHARVLIDGVEQDIPKYLKSREYYTSEEYNSFATA